MKRCGLAVAVPDAPALVRQQAQYVTRARGGRGAAREFCEIILHAQGSLAARRVDYRETMSGRDATMTAGGRS
jgi:3-deoxy-D-manno-octulosonate 8-phosphate phosphatase (KDO 8-P phosphatase)